MPGINLNLPIPSLADTQTVVITKIASALTTIQNDLTPQVTSSELNINSVLEMGGNNLNNLGTAKFTNTVVTPPVPGTLYYTGTDLAVTTAAGNVILTNNGGVNVTTTGGIGGDYSAPNALVSYNLALDTYSFNAASPTDFSTIKCSNLLLQGTNATVNFGVNNSLVSNKIINIASLPTTNRGLLLYDSATNSITDGNTNTITGAVTFAATPTFSAGLTVSGTITGTTLAATSTVTAPTATIPQLNGNILINGLIQHSTVYTAELPLISVGDGTTPANNNIAIGNGIILANSSGAKWTTVPVNSGPMRTNDILQSMVFRINKTTTGSTTVDIKRRDVVTGTITNVQSFSTTTIGASDFTCTVSSPIAVATRTRWYADLTFIAIGDTASACTISWTQ